MASVTVEFYKHCFDLIGPVVVENFNQAYEYRELSDHKEEV